MTSYKGLFTPKFPIKYVGDPKKIVYRSLWERQFMVYLDQNPAVLRWGSEEIAINYYDPVRGKQRRYYPDFIVIAKSAANAANKSAADGENNITKMIVEIKPSRETREPVRRKKTARYLTEVATWETNKAKWQAANAFCAENGYIFKLVTENELKIRYK